jgi:flagellin-like protein
MKAITPIIAIILLMLITVSAAGAAFLWIQIVQSQVSEETQTGLTSSLMQMHGRVAIEAVWNETGGHICMIVRNSGTHQYEQSDLSELTVYIEGAPYQINTTTITSELQPQASLVLCLCNSTEAGGSDCDGPTNDGYDYTGDIIDITLQPPAGTGDSYNNYQAT